MFVEIACDRICYLEPHRIVCAAYYNRMYINWVKTPLTVVYFQDEYPL